MIERQVRHLVRLVDDLLDVSRITRGKIELRKEPVDLAAVVAPRRRDGPPADRGPRPRADGRRCPPEPVRLDGRPDPAGAGPRQPAEQRRQVHRAGRPDPADGRAGGRRGRSSGCGTPASASPPSMLPRVFDLFAQVDRALGPRAGRAGHRPDPGADGWSRCTAARSRPRSDGPGQGSEFVVRLPVLPSAAAEAGRRRRDEPQAPPRPPAPRASWSWTTTWTRPRAWPCCCGCTGHEVRVAHDGPAALDEARGRSGPRWSCSTSACRGWTATRWPGACANEPALAHVRLIALTGYGQEEDRRRVPRGRVRPPPRQAGGSRRAAGAAGVGRGR